MSESKLESMIRHNAKRAWTLAMALCGNDADADDLVQQSLMVAHKKSDVIPDGNPWPWFARILTYEARNMRRKNPPATNSEKLDWQHGPASGDPIKTVLSRDLLDLIKKELGNLTLEEREALVLTRISNLSYREAASTLGIPLSTLGDRVNQALKELRSRCGLRNEALCLALTSLPFAEPVGGMEQASIRWIAKVNTVKLASSVILGAALVKKISVVIVTLIVVGLSWSFFSDIGDLEPNLDGTSAVVLDHAKQENSPKPRRQEALIVSREQPANVTDKNPQTKAIEFGPVFGRVTWDGHTPEAINVVARAWNQSQPDGDGVTELASGVTDERGRFKLDIRGFRESNTKRIEFYLQAGIEGGAGTTTHRLWLEPGGSLKDIHLRVFDQARLSGRVISSTKKEPLAGVRIAFSVQLPQGNDLLECVPTDSPVVTDEDGHFQIDALPPGEVRLYPLLPLGKKEFISPADAAKWSRKMEEGKDVHGVEIEIATERLIFAAKEVDEHDLSLSFVRNGNDYFSATAIRKGDKFVATGIGFEPAIMSISPEGKASRKFEVQLIRGQDLDLGVLEFEELGTLRGRVTFENGDVVPHAIVALSRGSNNQSRTASTNEHGEFMLDKIVAGEWTLSVFSNSIPIWHESITWPCSSPEHLVVIKKGGRIEGKVTLGKRLASMSERGGDGRVQHLAVSLFPGDARMPPAPERVLYHGSKTVPDTSGQYCFEHLAPGTYSVAATFERRVVYRAQVSVGAGETKEVDLNVEAGGTIKGSIRGWRLAGKKTGVIRLARSAIEVKTPKSALYAKVDESGEFVLKGVPSGIWFVKLPGETILAGNEIVERRLKVSDGVESHFDLDMAKPILHGVVGTVLLGGEVFLRQVLLVKPGQALPAARATIRADGTFSLPLKTKGDYYLWFTNDIFNPKILHRETIAFDGNHLRLNLDLEPASLRGQATLSEPQRCSVTLKPLFESTIGFDGASKFAILQSSTDQEGRFQFPRLCSGRYRLRIMPKHLSPIERIVDVKGDVELGFGEGEKGGNLELRVEALTGFAPEDFGKGAYDDLAFVKLYDGNGKEVGGLGSQRVIRLVKHAVYTTEAIPAGTYRMVVTGKLIESLEQTVQVKGGDNQVVPLHFHRSAEIVLQIKNQDVKAEDLSGVSLHVTDSSGKSIKEIEEVLATGTEDREALANRCLRIAPLTAGKFRVEVVLPGFETKTIVVDLARGESRVLATHLEKR